VPVPEPGEIVVFTAHFIRGFGLPSSSFFRSFLDRYELQPHHLPANAVFLLSSFVAFCEGFVGLLPSLTLWARLYTLRINSIQDPNLPLPKPVVQCGACIVVPRQKSPHVKMAGLDSCRKWQRNFFYVKNAGPVDLINLPDYVAGEPSRANWTYNPKDSHSETNRILRYIVGLRNDDVPTADDIVRTFIARRVLPLQERCHKICQMSGPLDPTRITTFELSAKDIVLKVKAIAQTKMTDDWEWDMEPFSRDNPPPMEVRILRTSGMLIPV
jgi:hypothetical protein